MAAAPPCAELQIAKDNTTAVLLGEAVQFLVQNGTQFLPGEVGDGIGGGRHIGDGSFTGVPSK
jgi:hypothetical protein